MKVAHHINDDRRSGYFIDEFGYKICHWTWDGDTSTLRVRVGYTERPVDLSASGLDRLSEAERHECLVQLARDTGRALGANFGT